MLPEQGDVTGRAQDFGEAPQQLAAIGGSDPHGRAPAFGCAGE